MFYKKTSKLTKIEKIELNILDFSKGLSFNKEENVLDQNYSVNCYNFEYKKGVLTENYGFETLTCPNDTNDNLTPITLSPTITETVNFVSAWFFKVYDTQYGGRVDKLMYYAEDKGLYYNRIISPAPYIFRVYNDQYTEKPSFSYNIKLNGVDYNLFGSEKMGVYKFDGVLGPVLLSSCPNMSSMCEDKDKLFCTGRGEKNMIYYHMGKDFTTWTTTADENNGIIELNDDRGKVNKVIPFLGYVYAIRDYGISKIYHSENRTKFDITNLSLSGNKIYENTVCICGDKMLMLTKEGITTFNGVTTTVLSLGINDLLKNVNNDNAEAVFHSGKYYLACKVNFNDSSIVGCESENVYKNNTIIILDVETNEYDIVRGVDVSSMVSIKLNKMDKIAMILHNRNTTSVIGFNKSGAFFNTPLEKQWVSPLSDLGYSNKIKFVRAFSVLSKYNCKITIFTENESKVFSIVGCNIINKIKVNLKGKQIGIKIETDTAKAYISNIKLEIDLLDYGYTK